MKKKIFALGLLYVALCLLSLAVSIKLATILLLVGILALLAFAALLYMHKNNKFSSIFLLAHIFYLYIWGTKFNLS